MNRLWVYHVGNSVLAKGSHTVSQVVDRHHRETATAEARSDQRSISAMKGLGALFLLVPIVLSVVQAACQARTPLSDNVASTVSIIGVLKPWTAETPVAGRHVLLCHSEGDPRDGICTLMEDAVTTDQQGRFQIYDVSPGTYFVLYDSGLSDFDEALAKWGGETLHFGDQEWMSEFLGVDLSEDGFEYRVPESISFSPHAGWLSSYCMLTLLVGESPFIIAHDLQSARHDRELHCALINVLPGQTAKVDVEVLYFGD